jgi:hypothetical protein
MYFPYLRGKQYELLALKELSALLGSQHKVVPIIEPVRGTAGSGLDRCLVSLMDSAVDCILVMNPRVGELLNPLVAPDIAGYLSQQTGSANWNLGLIVDERTDVAALTTSYRNQAAGQAAPSHPDPQGPRRRPRRPPLAHLRSQPRDGRDRRSLEASLLPRSSFILTRVTLRDGFPGEERNAAYLGKEESVFTDDHLFFAEESWYGFSDYLTIGEPYSDGGFTPRAVAIHWTYEPQVGGPVMIRHFTSVSNGDTSNVGGKFLQAAGKLVAFLDAQNIHTQASDVMRTHAANSTYPGLGIVKKLSIQNHLELVSGILSRP